MLRVKSSGMKCHVIGQIPTSVSGGRASIFMVDVILVSLSSVCQVSAFHKTSTPLHVLVQFVREKRICSADFSHKVSGPTTPIWVVPWSLDENTNNSDVKGTKVKEDRIIKIINAQPWTHIHQTRQFWRFYFLQLSKRSCASTVSTAYCFLCMTNICTYSTLSRPSRTEAEALFIRAWYGTKPC